MKIEEVKHPNGFIEIIRSAVSESDEARWMARVNQVKTFPSVNHRFADRHSEQCQQQQEEERPF